MAKLGEVCLINPKSCTLRDDTEVSFIPMTKVGEHGEFDASEIKNYSEVKKGFTNFQNGDILFAKITPCMENGKGAIAHNMKNGIGFGSTEFHVLRPDTDKITSEWLYYLTTWKTFRKEAEKNMTGSAGQKRVPKTFLENYVVNLPDIDTQKSENKILRKVDDLIFLRKQQLSKLDELVKARFVEMFGDPKDNRSNLVKIGEIGDLTSGGTPSRSNSEYFNGSIRWYSAGELNSLYLPDSIEHISRTALSQSAAKLFEKGTLMIGMYDTAAFKMGILTEQSSSNQACANLKPTEQYSVIWLYYLFDIMKPIFLNERQGVRQKNLSLSKIRNFNIPSAPLALQNQFAAFVERVDQQKQTVQQSLEKLELMKKALMQEYFG